MGLGPTYHFSHKLNGYNVKSYFACWSKHRTKCQPSDVRENTIFNKYGIKIIQKILPIEF